MDAGKTKRVNRMINNNSHRVLGIDLGANSVGWALVQFKNNEPCDIVDMGVRIFDAGAVGDIDRGMDESPAVERRIARQRRRQIGRQSDRIKKTACVLQKHGLLPQGDVNHGKARHEYFVALDRHIRETFEKQGISASSPEGLRELPYFLRARGLDTPLEPHAFGRALYHLAQRRGFLSNRKTEKDDKETGKVKEGIAELAQAMEAAGTRTLGEYFYRTDPVKERRIRNRWTARDMYRREFELLWVSQEKHHSDLMTLTAHREIYDAIFYQRPLKSQKGLVGRCELEPSQRRAAKALLISQRFRILQKVNDLRMHYLDGTECTLSSEEKVSLAALMDEKEEITFAGIQKALKLDKTVEFNLERGGEKKLKGNTTAARIHKAIGIQWDRLDYTEKCFMVSAIMGVENPDTLQEMGRVRWGLNPEEAASFAKIHLEEGYCALSKRAMKKLQPLLEQGISFKTAEKQVYEDAFRSKEVLEALPPVRRHPKDKFCPEAVRGLEIRNPVVMRTLTEMRKVVNALMVKYGKPDAIHLELAREMKKSREERKNIWKDNRERENRRSEAFERIKKEDGKPSPSRADVEKVLLAEECGWQCPYTGKSISMGSLLGDNSQFDVEHIIPFSRCLNDGFINKTLCYHEENRTRKRNKTPWEAYGETEQWEEIITRVQKFTGDAARIKLERFQIRETDAFDEIASQKLNDTRYASKLAARYLGFLYGEESLSRIQTNTGQITAKLRDGWRLNSILAEDGLKNREDHRHHAIDALVIALTTRSAIKQLSDAAVKQSTAKGRTRGFEKQIPQPWDSFLADTAAQVEKIVISRRIKRRIRGRLHEDTNYGPPRKDEKGKAYHPIRKPLTDTFENKNIEEIIDPGIRKYVLEHFVKNGRNSKQAFSDPANHPVTPYGTPIHRVRIRKVTNAFPLGSDDVTRYVTTDTNHHMEIVEYKDKKGNVKWEGIIVNLLEATQRKLNKQPVINPDHGPGRTLICTLSSGDIIQVTEDEQEKVFLVRTCSGGNVEMSALLDARKKTDIKAEGAWIKRSADKLRQLNMIKLHVTPLGEVYPCHD